MRDYPENWKHMTDDERRAWWRREAERCLEAGVAYVRLACGERDTALPPSERVWGIVDETLHLYSLPREEGRELRRARHEAERKEAVRLQKQRWERANARLAELLQTMKSLKCPECGAPFGSDHAVGCGKGTQRG